MRGEYIKGLRERRKRSFWKILIPFVIFIVLATVLAVCLSKRPNPGSRLTLDDVKRLAGKGDALTWEDFEGYENEDVGSGIFVYRYPIDGHYDLLIGSPQERGDILYICLRDLDTEASIDIRTEDTEAFLRGDSPAYELVEMKRRYPEYFDLDTFKGLEVYVWQMSPDDYSCGLMSGTNRDKTPEELAALKGVTLHEMSMILASYDVDEKKISVIPWQNPVSSYIADYWTDRDGEDPAEAQKRKQEYIDGIRQMLFGGAQTGNDAPAAPLSELRSAVAYVNWTQGEMIPGCLNMDKMMISSVRHLPVYKLDTKEDLDRFRENYGDILTLDHGYNEVPSFNEVVSSYDESFFAGHTVILAYVSASSGSLRYALKGVWADGSALCLDVIQTNDPEGYTGDMAGWLVMAELSDADVAGYSEFDARLVDR